MDAESGDANAVHSIGLEVAVLAKMIYRNKSQHGRTKYYQQLERVRRVFEKRLDAERIPALLTDSVALLGRKPEKAVIRLHQQWARSLITSARKLKAALAVVTEGLQAILDCSRLLAHQISRTYFMALCLALLAGQSRLYVCGLYLAGRLMEVHGAVRGVLSRINPALCEIEPKELEGLDIDENIQQKLTIMRNAPVQAPPVSAPGAPALQPTSRAISAKKEPATLVKQKKQQQQTCKDEVGTFIGRSSSQAPVKLPQPAYSTSKVPAKQSASVESAGVDSGETSSPLFEKIEASASDDNPTPVSSSTSKNVVSKKVSDVPPPALGNFFAEKKESKKRPQQADDRVDKSSKKRRKSDKKVDARDTKKVGAAVETVVVPNKSRNEVEVIVSVKEKSKKRSEDAHGGDVPLPQKKAKKKKVEVEMKSWMDDFGPGAESGIVDYTEQPEGVSVNTTVDNKKKKKKKQKPAKEIGVAGDIDDIFRGLL